MLDNEKPSSFPVGGNCFLLFHWRISIIFSNEKEKKKKRARGVCSIERSIWDLEKYVKQNISDDCQGLCSVWGDNMVKGRKSSIQKVSKAKIVFIHEEKPFFK